MDESGNARARLTLPADNQILITRDFRAPRDVLFDAWTDPAFVRQWYGCAEQQVTVCDIDFRVGGAWRWVLQQAFDGSEHAFSGAYREIARPERVVFTQVYEPYPMADHVVTLTFEEARPGVTTMSMLIEHHSQQMRDGHLQSGMESGLEDTMARLEQIAGRQASAA